MDTNETIKMGRRGRVDADGSMALEIQAYAGNRPRVHRVVGVNLRPSDRFARLEAVMPSSKDLSGGGNGYAYYDLPAGLYFVEDVLGTSSSRSAHYISIGETFGEIDDVEATVGARFPSEAALRASELEKKEALDKRAAEISTAIADERSQTLENEPKEIDGITVTPEFGTLPSASRIAAELAANQAINVDEFIAMHSLPTHYIVSQPVFAKAATAEQAVASAKEKVAQREAQLKAAQAAATDAGLPPLKGTPRQIAWAETLRAKAAAANPANPALRKATTAKYWIEHR